VVDSPAPTIPVAPAPTLDTTRAARVTADSARREEEFLDTLHAARPDTTEPVTVAVAPSEVRSEAEALLGRPEEEAARITWDIDVETQADHARVQYWMSFFTGRSRWHFERYLERQSRYDSMIRTRLAAAGLPRDMIYLSMIESGFNQNARSRAGAVGLWQFMPETGRRYGLTFDSWVDDRRDPSLATDAAIRFLSELNDRFGSMWLAAAAYNGGPGRVIRGLARGDFGALNGDQAYFAMTEAGGQYFRAETRDYVPKLIAAALLAKEPARYGFTNLNYWTPLRYDSLQVTDAIGLDVVARVAGVALTDIEEMNPRFYRGVTPPGRSVWLRVPAGLADSVAARIARVPARDRVTLVWHTVVRGETLSRIARRYGVSVNDIRSANRLRSTTLQRGQRLIIPTSARGVRTAAAAEPGRYISGASTTQRSTSRTAPRSTAARRTHVVRRGETLWSISQAFNVDLPDLMRVNGLTRRSVIQPGQRIRLP
jgi:membrane-bound lytic murein transglycosylase D